MGRRLVGVYVDPRVDREIEHLSVDAGRTKSELYELGAKLLLNLVWTGKVSEELESELARLRQALAETETARADAR